VDALDRPFEPEPIQRARKRAEALIAERLKELV
jgi:hypothetical protein